MTLTWIKRIVGTALCLLTVGCASAEVSCGDLQSSYAGKRIAVLSFAETTKEGVLWTVLVAGHGQEHIGDRVARRLETRLIEQRYYKVADRAAIQQVMEERKLTLSEVSSAAQARELARLAGLDGIVVVQTRKDGGWLFPIVFCRGIADVRLIDVASGEIVWTANGRYVAVSIIPLLTVFFVDEEKRLVDALMRELVEANRQ